MQTEIFKPFVDMRVEVVGSVSRVWKSATAPVRRILAWGEREPPHARVNADESV